MTRIMIATVGRSPEPIILGIRHFSVDRLYLLHSPNTEEVANKIKFKVDALIGQDLCEMVQIDAFNFNDIVSHIVGIAKSHRGVNLQVNITGGTNIMASAALVACFTIGANAFYVKETKMPRRTISESIIELPVPRVPLDSLEKVQRRILRFIHEHGDEIEPANVKLAEGLDMSRQSASYHLRSLKTKGLITVELKGRSKNAKLTLTGVMFAELGKDR